jgi:[ribosomal protein S18]-alanine N-acetyltransferase
MCKDYEIQNTNWKQCQQERILRLATESDLPAVLAIEQASFSQPWTSTAFRNEFNNPYSRLWVLEERTLVIGYVCTWFIDDEGQIVNVAVLPAYRRQGIGRFLVQHVLQEAKKQGVRSLSLEVRSSNFAAVDLYRSFGFERIAVRERYYENGEDALLMVCEIFLYNFFVS